jgi:hypothetical protein
MKIIIFIYQKCPVEIESQQKRNNLTNTHAYTKAAAIYLLIKLNES